MTTNNEKIKRSDVRDIRAEMLSNQSYTCALCKKSCDPSEAALDHDHKSGRVRGVLHSSCNILLGKVENFTARYGQALIRHDRLHDALSNMNGYIKRDYSENKLHYRHKTPEDKLILKYKRLVKRSKKPETRAKYQALIKEITDERQK